MKIIFLAPGLARIKRGAERFILDLSTELQKAGLPATCWGTTEAPGVEAIPVASRIELQKFGREQLQNVPDLDAVPASALQDWALYAEDQLFAVPAAMRIQKLLDQGESLLVYARWQGGLIDPSGAPTDLLRVLSTGRHRGNASLLVHTDYIYTPIDSALWAGGATFHSIGPWISESLRSMNVIDDAIVELPMCIHAERLRGARRHRESMRAQLGIPDDAFVVMSAGAFDTITPDKRHGHLLDEILQIPDGQKLWWIVAGSRGAVTAAWEERARRALGHRFLPLTNLPFEEMPRVYGASDVFALASVQETFGLVYIEAQMAGLPVIIHDSRITRHLCKSLTDAQQGVSLIDMRRSGSAAAAVSCWRNLLTGPQQRGTLDSLEGIARAQEHNFGWRSVAPRYAKAFEQIMRTTARSAGLQRVVVGPWDEQSHKQGIRLYEQGKHDEALAAIAKALGTRETSERWNDWATVQSALGRKPEAEQGFRRAIALAPGHSQAAANLGAVLATTGRFGEAINWLEASLTGVDEQQRASIVKLIETCKTRQNGGSSEQSKSDDAEIRKFLTKHAGRLAAGGDGDGHSDSTTSVASSFTREDLLYCETLLKQVPAGTRDQKILGIGPYGELLASALILLKGYKAVEWRVPQHEGGLGAENRFAIHDAPWPFEEHSYDVLIFPRTLEMIAPDPMLVLAEINRLLKPGGLLILSAANIASAKGLHALLSGGTPYVDGRFRATAAGAHREYTKAELETLATAAGFGTIQTQTCDVLWQMPETLMPSLAALGFAVGSRGDTIFLTARKECGVRDRFPAKLYNLRTAQPALTALSDAPMRILVVFETLPLLDGGGAEHRLMQILRLLREQGHAVTFLAPRSFGKETCEEQLKQLGVEIRVEDAEVRRQEGADIFPRWTLQEVLREGQFDLAILSLWFWMGVTLPEHYLDEIRRFSPATRIAILTDDCHGVREAGAADLSGLWSDHERATDFSEREIEIYRRSDFVICISNADREKIACEIGETPCGVVPMMIEPGPQGPGFAERDGIVYFGHYNNPPSLDGLEWYIREVAPLVREQLPNVKHYVLGAGLPESWSTSDPNVVRVGFRLDLAPEFAARRVFISPVRFGTGIKTKNLHALAHGLPIVTNTKGADGADFVAGETAIIADDPRGFADAVVKVYRDASLWRRLSENSVAHAHKNFSSEKMAAALRDVLEQIRVVRPQAYDPEHEWSMRRVEKMFLEVLTFQPARNRHTIRILAYARAADQLLAKGNRREARRQLRHVFNFVSHEMSRSIFFSSFLAVAEAMEKTYRALGEDEAAAAFRREGRTFSAAAFREDPNAEAAGTWEAGETPVRAEQRERRAGGELTKLDFSVIVPTCNRSATLAQCLKALDGQSLSPYRFEVIVVDDGSEDHTRELCEAHKPRYEFHYSHRQNGGAGAARRMGVEKARGKYLLLMNDDTIASRELLAGHLVQQRAHASDKVAVLGDFKYPAEARNRALTWFLHTSPFLFPQVTLKAGIHTSHSLFVTCNISVRRDAVEAAGSFDETFRVAEDTDLGIRLVQRGLRILYAPELAAEHRHLEFTIADLLQRAEIYGKTLVNLYEKHPSLLVAGQDPFGDLGPAAIAKLRAFLAEHEESVPRATESLAKFDTVDFSSFFGREIDGRNAADEVMNLFARSIPILYWYRLFRSFLAAGRIAASAGAAVPCPDLVPQTADA